MPKMHLLTAVALLCGAVLCLAGCGGPRTQNLPKADFELGPERGQAPLSVQFADKSLPGDGAISVWSWTFGDGGKGSGSNPVHEYKAPGVYDVQLVITTAEGNFTYVKEGAVVVEAAGAFGGVDPETGMFTGEGVVITVPVPLREDIAFGVRRDESMALGSYGALTALSDTFTLTHNLGASMAAVFGADGVVQPLTVAVPLLGAPPSGADSPGAAQLLVRYPDGHTTPVPGAIRDGALHVSVARLPERASYVAVLHESATLADTRSLGLRISESATEAGWAASLRVHGGVALNQQVTALYRGIITNESSFLRRDFAANNVTQSMNQFGLLAQQSFVSVASSGLRAPALVSGGGGYDVLFFNMQPVYDADFESVADLTVFDTFLGHVVVDPGQLLAVTIRNARGLKADETAVDWTQRFHPESAFAEALMRSVYPAYPIAHVVTVGSEAQGLPEPADRTGQGDVRPVSFMRAFYDGAALFAGQRAANLGGRGFGENEYFRLSDPLLFPYSAVIPDYGMAGHEFFAHLYNNWDFGDPMAFIAEVLEGMLEAQALFLERRNRVVRFGEGLDMLRDVMDARSRAQAPSEDMGVADFYWRYFQDSAYDNSGDALLRPSDYERPPFTFNIDRFDEDGLVHLEFGSAVEQVFLTPEGYPALTDVPSLAGRAIVLDVHPLTSEVMLQFDFSGCVHDANGNGMAVAVFKEGQPGVALDAPRDGDRNYIVLDADNDGVAETVRVIRLRADAGAGLTRVVVLFANLNCSASNSLSVQANAFTDLTTSEDLVLRQYVQAYDPLYQYTPGDVYTGTEGYVVYTLDMVSGAWRGMHEVNPSVWRHPMAIIEPTNVSETTALLLVSGGSTSSPVDATEVALLGELAVASKSVVALVKGVPNQPLVFTDETRNRSEDAIIAYSYNEYLEWYDAGEPDMTWPALLPMTRAAVRAMDTVQSFMSTKPGRVQNIERFVVTGASKRGWTTWLAAAADDRVAAIMPMVIDVLNMEEQMEHHRRAYASLDPRISANYIVQSATTGNNYSRSIRDYVDFDIFDRFDNAAGQSLLRIVDPYRYLDALDMPKMIINSTGDQFFLPDSSQFYYDELQGDRYLYYAPNTDHSLTESLSYLDAGTMQTLMAFYIAQVRNNNQFANDNVSIPGYEWAFSSVDDTARIQVESAVAPAEVLVWTIDAPRHRDFRVQTLGATGARWVSAPVTMERNETSGLWVGEVEETIPETGWRGMVVQLRFPGPVSGADFHFSTPVYVIPQDKYPEPFTP